MDSARNPLGVAAESSRLARAGAFSGSGSGSGTRSGSEDDVRGYPLNEPLHRPGVSRPISAGREDRAAAYQAYLQSPQWRAQRNRALQRAGYRCSKCPGKRGLQVHHLSYERLGHEWDQDLQVLCETCHQDQHVKVSAQTLPGVYLKLASEAVKADPFGDIADLSDAIKTQCVQLGIVADAWRINAALAKCGLRMTPRPHVRRESPAPVVRGLSHGESRELLCRLGLGFDAGPTSMARVIKAMPAVIGDTDQVAHEQRLAEQIQQFKDWPAKASA